MSSSSFDEVTSSLQADHSHEQQPQGPSFAEMLRTTRVKSVNTWPSVATAMQSKSLDTAVTASIEDDEEARYVSPPLKNQSLGEALARAFDQTRLLELGTDRDTHIARIKKLLELFSFLFTEKKLYNQPNRRSLFFTSGNAVTHPFASVTRRRVCRNRGRN